ncbi:hypothetical protein ACFQV8_09595 [Pseudonocardia benzenivorans]
MARRELRVRPDPQLPRPRDNPDGFTDTVEVHARTAGGDIVVRRA